MSMSKHGLKCPECGSTEIEYREMGYTYYELGKPNCRGERAIRGAVEGDPLYGEFFCTDCAATVGQRDPLVYSTQNEEEF
jgi:hypothetical protein